MRRDQIDQPCSEYDLIYLGQETLSASLLAFGSVLGIGEVHLLYQAYQRLRSDFPLKLETFFSASKKNATFEKIAQLFHAL
jgi:hypothetical protein